MSGWEKKQGSGRWEDFNHLLILYLDDTFTMALDLGGGGVAMNGI